MKKLAAAITSLVLVLGLCGCSVTLTQPEDEIDILMEALKTQNEDVLIFYVDESSVNMLINATGDEAQLQKIYDNIFKNLKWKVKSVKVNDDNTKASVEVDVTNADFSTVLTNYTAESTKYVQENLYSSDFTKEVMTAKCMEIFMAQVEAASNNTEMITIQTVNVEMVKDQETLRWDIQDPAALINTAMGGIQFPQ